MFTFHKYQCTTHIISPRRIRGLSLRGRKRYTTGYSIPVFSVFNRTNTGIFLKNWKPAVRWCLVNRILPHHVGYTWPATAPVINQLPPWEAIRMQGNDVNTFVEESDFLESSFFRFNRSHFLSNLSQNFVMDKEHKSARHLFEQQ